MKLGFVCTNYNNFSFTRAAIASLYAGSRGDDVQIVVVDNRSGDEDVAGLTEMTREFPAVRLILNSTNVGYFSGLNVGILHLRKECPEVEHIVVGNNDLEFPQGFGAMVRECRDVFETHAIVAPDLVTPEGVHQNPHVRFPISTARKLVWDLYYFSYSAAVLIRAFAKYTRSFTVRPENVPGSDFYRTPGPVEQAYGACYILGPVFFRHFDRLCAPTFIMQEEFFLNEQLNAIGQRVYYDPRVVVTHRDHATMDLLPGRRLWAMSREAHHVYKRYLRLSPQERERVVSGKGRMPQGTGDVTAGR